MITVPVVFLMGPTAAGKTAMALRIAERFPVEIISVDAAQVYRGLDIGTAKASRRERAAVPHHLIDIIEPDQTYSAAQFRAEALPLVERVRARGRVPLLTGGTMFYFHTLLHDLPRLPASDAALRGRIRGEAAELGWPAVHRRLAALDPRRAGEIAPGDGRRIERALEINALTGRKVGRRTLSTAAPPWPLIKLALVPADRSSLHERIALRFRRMLDQGLVAEVERALECCAGVPEPPSLKLVGYRQVSQYLQGKVGYNRMVEASITATRRLAKRQLTWLRNQAAVTWIDSDHPEAGGGVEQYLEASPLMAGIRRPEDA